MSLSARDVEVLCAMCKSLKSKPETDMDKFAILAGFSTPASAYTNLRKVLKKIMEDGTVSSPETKKKGGGRKRKTDNGSEEDEEAVATPSKKKASPKKKSKASEEGEDAEGDVAVKDEA